jgi:hypothetical protein
MALKETGASFAKDPYRYADALADLVVELVIEHTKAPAKAGRARRGR